MCQDLFVFGATAPPPPSGAGPPHSRGFQITHNDVPQSVGLLWTSDQLVAETSTWQHATLTTDKHPCSRWDFFLLVLILFIYDYGTVAHSFIIHNVRDYAWDTMLTMGIRGRFYIIPVIQMTRVASSGSIIGLISVYIEIINICIS